MYAADWAGILVELFLGGRLEPIENVMENYCRRAYPSPPFTMLELPQSLAVRCQSKT